MALGSVISIEYGGSIMALSSVSAPLPHQQRTLAAHRVSALAISGNFSMAAKHQRNGGIARLYGLRIAARSARSCARIIAHRRYRAWRARMASRIENGNLQKSISASNNARHRAGASISGDAISESNNAANALATSAQLKSGGETKAKTAASTARQHGGMLRRARRGWQPSAHAAPLASASTWQRVAN